MTQPYDAAAAPPEPEAESAAPPPGDQVGEQVAGEDGHEASEHLGDPRVDTAVARLSELDDLPVSRHVEVFDDIHARLRDALESAAGDSTPA